MVIPPTRIGGLKKPWIRESHHDRMIYQQEIIQHWGTLANNCASPKRTEKCGRNVYGLWSHQIMHSIETTKKPWFPVYGSLEPTQFPPSSASLFLFFFGRHWSSCTPGKMGMMSVLRRWKMPRPRRLVVVSKDSNVLLDGVLYPKWHLQLGSGTLFSHKAK